MASPTQNAFNGRKLALVIGIHDYKGCDRPLNHLKKNAEDLRDQLMRIGFEFPPINDTPDGTMEMLQDFVDEIQCGDLVLVYLSGLYCHIDGKNYLLPAGDYETDTDEDFQKNANDVERMLERLLKDKKAHTVILILDCGTSYQLKNKSTSNRE
jgi:uncharacterized caspase-like protein